MTAPTADRRPHRHPERFSRAHEFDAGGTEDFDAPHATFRDLRAGCPVAHSNDLGGFWLLTRHADVVAAMEDWRTWSTAVQNVVPHVATTGRRPPLHLDPPDHTPYRRAIAPLFRGERMEHWGPVVRSIADELFAPLPPRGAADICRDFSYKLPLHVLAEFFLIPQAQAETIREVGYAFNAALQVRDLDAMQAASLALYDVAQAIIDDRRARPLDPGTCPTSALLAARDGDGDPLPEPLILGTIRQLLVVGIIAPTTFLGSCAIHFCRHPEHFDMMRADPARIPEIAEELLRLYTPYRGFARTPVRDVEIGGRTIRADEPVALAFTAANRDPEAYPDPDAFRPGREGPPNLAFGRGPHQCAGTPLAKLMIHAALEAFARRCEGFEAAGPTPMTDWPEYGPVSVPVRFRTGRGTTRDHEGGERE